MILLIGVTGWWLEAGGTYYRYCTNSNVTASHTKVAGWAGGYGFVLSIHTIYVLFCTIRTYALHKIHTLHAVAAFFTVFLNLSWYGSGHK